MNNNNILPRYSHSTIVILKNDGTRVMVGSDVCLIFFVSLPGATPMFGPLGTQQHVDTKT
jgi:hypothetical protein